MSVGGWKTGVWHTARVVTKLGADKNCSRRKTNLRGYVN